jgi:hypothetical protein
MNFLDAVSTTGYSTRAVAASDAGMFHEYTRTLFEHQPPEGGPGLTDGQLVELGQEIGISDAPSIEAGGELSHDDERRLYQHYDMPYPGEDTQADDASRSGDQTQSDADQRSSSASHACSGDSSTATVTRRRPLAAVA